MPNHLTETIMAYTEQERYEVNERMTELYGFSLDECLELSYKLRRVEAWSDSTPLTKLNKSAYAVRSKRKCMGANKGYKYTYTTVWSDRMTRAEYLLHLAEIDRKECGLFLCKLEFNELNEDKWWDVPGYRAAHLKGYRSKITSIRKEYGLTSSEVSGFMRVG